MLTLKQAKEQRRALLRDINRDHKKKAREKLLGLRQKLGDARAHKKARMAELVERCRSERLTVRARLNEMRARVLHDLRETMRIEREVAREACLLRRGETKTTCGSSIACARSDYLAEKNYQKDLRRIEQGNRERHRATRAHLDRAARRSESDDEVRSNISADLVPLFDRVKRSIKGSARMSRTEAFLILLPSAICGVGTARSAVLAGLVPLGGHITPARSDVPSEEASDDGRSCRSGREEVVMLEKYFLRLATLDRIRGSWIGSAVETYVQWLDERRYAPRVIFARVPTVMRFGDFAEQRGAKIWDDLPDHVDAFVDDGVRVHERKRHTKASRRKVPGELRRPVEQMLRLVVPSYKGRGRARRTTRPFTAELPRFFDYLASERGISRETIYSYDCYVTAFEKFLVGESVSLAAVTPRELTAFVTERAAAGVQKPGLVAVCNCLRVLLRYAHRQGVMGRDLSAVVDSPLVYRLSTVPRSIPWDEVKKLIRDVDRRDTTGKRDYALLLLLVTYGLRVKEVASLLIDDVDWKHDRIRIRDRKIGNSTGYPLTPTVGEALIEYIRDARPTTQDRHVFMRRVAPLQPIGAAAITARMRTLLASAGISVPRPGGQVFRHSCVQRLVDAETPYKTISDYVGHRSTLSQGTYAKISVEALRDVALGDGEAVL